MAYVKLVGHKNRHESWIAEVVLERDDDGNVTKSVQVGVPGEVTAEDQKALEAKGFVFEKSSKQEAEEVAASSGGAAPDVAGSAPTFGPSGSEENDQA
jgi:hypothetical protein